MFNIRVMETQDIEAAAEIEAENFSRPWSLESFLSAIENPQTLYLAAEASGTLVGYIGMWIALEEGEITNVSVKKEYQNQGIGKKLLEALQTEGEKKGVSVYFLEVRKSNEAALHLYEKAGFERAGLRKDFYEAPVEDGVLMCKR